MSDTGSDGPDFWGPDPERARQLAGPLVQELGADGERRRSIERLCAHAPFLVPWLRRQPEWLAQGDPRCPVDADALRDALASQIADASDARAALRRFKYKHLLRITLRDLDPALVPLETSEAVLGELSILAETLLDAAFSVAAGRHAETQGAARFGGTPVSCCVLGLGKLGSGELNYSSDVDLIYIISDVEPGAANAAGATAAEYFGRVARDFGSLVEERSEDGFLYRIDLDLRPEGARGPLVLSESALASYYESRADTWERAAFAKARPVAGDLELGWRAIRSVHPILYRSTMDLSTVQGIRALKQRVVEEYGAVDGVFDVKRDPGGIRDIEFVAQALQLLHGGRIPQLRDPSTLGALLRLGEVGLLPPDEVEGLATAYRFLRRLENRLQMRDEQQVHRVGTDPEALRGWAAAMQMDASIFTDALTTHRRSAEDAAGRIVGEDRVEAVLELLARHQPRLLALPESRPMMEQLAHDLSREITASADPELAFNNLDRFVGGVGGRRFYYELLLDRPELIPRLCALFASSRFLSNLLTQYPRLIEPVFDDPGQLLLNRDELRSDLETLRREHDVDRTDLESTLRALRLFAHRHTLNVGLLDLAGAVERAPLEAALSDLAQITLEGALAAAEAQLASRRPASLRDASFLVVGMGKFGSRELGYGSDLDLIFLYDLDTANAGGLAEAQDFFVRLAQRLISVLQTQTTEGRCYEIDPRLRPSGGQGSLVCSVSAFERYHADESQTWEKQALLRARPVAGSEVLGQRFEAARLAILEGPLETDLAGPIYELRERMERELARERPGHRDFKTGRGGLLDVESSVQYLQLRHGKEHDELLRPDPIERQIERLTDLGLLEKALATPLRDGFSFLQRLSKALRIAENRSISDLDTERGDLDRLGRAMGYRPSARERDVRRALLRDYERHTEAIRTAYQEILNPAQAANAAD